MNRHILQLALCGGGNGSGTYVRSYMYKYGCIPLTNSVQYRPGASKMFSQHTSHTINIFIYIINAACYH